MQQNVQLVDNSQMMQRVAGQYDTGCVTAGDGKRRVKLKGGVLPELERKKEKM